ncbi:CBN-BCMO-2 protein [Aphelenchoides avenae]|nr:CBN-BCMO-2 protein [Aphelenchus avenae]
MLPCNYHSFGMSANQLVMFDTPLRMNIYTILRARWKGTAFCKALEWHPGRSTHLHVVNYHTGENHPVTFTAPPFFTFHHANAFEKDGYLVVDYCKIQQADWITNALELNALREYGVKLQSDKERAFLHRMIIPLEVSDQLKPGADLLRSVSFAGQCRAIVEGDGKTIRLQDERLCASAFDFPRYNYDRNAKEYRYCYGTHILSDEEDLEGIVKADLAKRTHLLWNKDHKQQICGEPVFVPRLGAVEEDDGVVVCPVMTSKDGDKPFVLVLNAHDMSELARCTVEHLLPLGFHAQFY